MSISDTSGQHKSELFNPDQPGTFCWVSGTVTYPKPVGKKVKVKGNDKNTGGHKA